MLKLTTIALAIVGAVALPISNLTSANELISCESAPGNLHNAPAYPAGYCNPTWPVVGGEPAVCFDKLRGLCYGSNSNLCGSRDVIFPGKQFCDDKSSYPPPPSPPSSPPPAPPSQQTAPPVS